MSHVVSVITIEELDGSKRIVGKSNGTIFYRRVSSSIHLLINKNAWSIDSKVFYDYIVPHESVIVIFDREKEKYYVSSTNNFRDHGELYLKSGQRAQIILSLNYFTVYDKVLPAVYDVSGLEYRG